MLRASTGNGVASHMRNRILEVYQKLPDFFERQKRRENKVMDGNPDSPADIKFDFVFDQSIDLATATKAGTSVNNAFFKEHFTSLNQFHKLGVSLYVNAHCVIGSFNGIKFHLRSKEDFQLIHDIYIVNDYKLISGRDKLVADIGMNAGYAALFFAKQSSIVEVHSYEPFALPFERAKSNFALNLRFAVKIRANHYGLGAHDDNVTVLTSDETTIDTSIRGLDSGLPEKISIRSATRELSALGESAKARNLDFIVKMDCEGSEFPIFEALEQDDVFRRIDVMMVEWHKWWSTQKNSSDLIEPLIARGFTIFDRTSDSNPHAGMLYAIRTAR
jgi:FkbM family methyltransferase